MDQEDIMVCVRVCGTKELYHLGKEDGIDMFVGIENVDAREKGGILDGGYKYAVAAVAVDEEAGRELVMYFDSTP